MIRLSDTNIKAKVQYHKRALKGLVKMPRWQAVKMKTALSEISKGNVKGKDIKPLQGRPGYRLRRGIYRAIYKPVDNGILVLDIAPRSRVYGKP